MFNGKKKKYAGVISNGGFRQSIAVMELEVVGDEYRRKAVGRLPMTAELQAQILNPTAGILYRFEASTGEEFDLAIAGKVDVVASHVSVQSSGRIPGLLE